MRDQELLIFRLAMIGRIVENCSDVGKTKVQKISYFLQESVGVPLKYAFRMHYFGPYSDELDGVLSFAKALGEVEITPDPEGFGYHVTQGSTEERNWSEAYDLSKDPKVAAIDKAVNDLGSLETYELELFATIHFINMGLDEPIKGEVLRIVGGLKPKFSEDAIGRAYQSLQNAGFI